MQNAPIAHFGPIDFIHPEQGLNAYMQVPAFEQFPTYGEGRPTNNAADIINNAAADVDEFGKGTTALFSLPFKRLREIATGTAPPTFPTSKQPGESDVEKMGQAATAVGANYMHRYLDPLQQESTAPGIVGAYFHKWAEAPLFTGLDLGWATALKPLNAFVGTPLLRVAHPKLNELLQGAEINSYMANKINTLDSNMQSTLRQATAEMDKTAKALPPEYQGPALTAAAEQTGGATAKARATLAAMHVDPRVDEALKTLRKWSDVVYGIIKPSTSTHLVAQTAPKRMAEIYRHTGTQVPFSEFYPSRKVSDNIMPGPPRSLGNGRYYQQLEAAQAQRQAAGLPGPIHIPIVDRKYAQAVAADADKVLGGHMNRAMRLAAKIAGKVYQDVEHAPTEELPTSFRPRLKSHIKTPGRVPSAADVANMKRRLGKGRKGNFSVPRDALKGATEYSSPYYTTRTIHHVHNPGLAVKHSLIQALQYDALYKLLKGLRDEVGDTAYHKGWMEVNVVNAFKTLAEGTGVEDKAIEAAMQDLKRKGGESIWLPPKAANALYDAMRPRHVNRYSKALRFSNKIYTRGLFALDPTFEIMLAIRTGVIQGFTFRHPKDVATFIAASYLAQDPAIAKRFGTSILLSHGGHADIGLIRQIDAATHPNPIMRAGAQFANNVKRALDKKMEIGYAFHNKQRLASFIANYYKEQEKAYRAQGWIEGAGLKANLTRTFTDAVAHSLSKVHNTSPTVQQLFADCLDTSNMLEKMNLYYDTPKNLMAAQRVLTGTLGDYGAASYQEMEALREHLPLMPFIKHCKTMIMHIPGQHPAKVALMGTLGHFMIDKMGTDQYGRLPMTNADGTLQLGTGGGVKNFNAPATDPLIGGFELINDTVQIGNAVLNPTEFKGVSFPSSVNPLERMAAMVALSRYKAVDMETGKPYIEEHPDVVKIQGTVPQAYRNVLTGQILTDQSLPGLWWAKELGPKQVAPLQQLLAYPGERSIWSSFGRGNQAQKRVAGAKFRPDTGFRPTQDLGETWGWGMAHLGATEGPPAAKRVWGRVLPPQRR